MSNSPTWLGVPKSAVPVASSRDSKPVASSGASPRSTVQRTAEFAPQQFCPCSKRPDISSRPATGLRQPITTACSGPGAMSTSPGSNRSPTSYSAVTRPTNGANGCPTRKAHPSTGLLKSFSPDSASGAYFPSRNHSRVSTGPRAFVVRRKYQHESSWRSGFGFRRPVPVRNSSAKDQRKVGGATSSARTLPPSGRHQPTNIPTDKVNHSARDQQPLAHVRNLRQRRRIDGCNNIPSRSRFKFSMRLSTPPGLFTPPSTAHILRFRFYPSWTREK